MCHARAARSPPECGQCDGKVSRAGITHFYLSSLLQSLFHFYVSLKTSVGLAFWYEAVRWFFFFFSSSSSSQLAREMLCGMHENTGNE